MNRKDELTKLGQHDCLIVTTVETLKEAFRQWAEELLRQRTAEQTEAMLDEATVRQRLGRSRATLWRWNATGYLPCHKAGGKKLYRLADVERIERGLKQ